MLAFTVLILIISYIDTKIERGEVDVLNDQKCPSERSVAGIPFRGGELKCYNEKTIIDKGRLIDINKKEEKSDFPVFSNILKQISVTRFRVPS